MGSFKDRGHISWFRSCNVDFRTMVSNSQFSHIGSGVGFKPLTSELEGKYVTHYSTVSSKSYARHVLVGLSSCFVYPGVFITYIQVRLLGKV